MNGKRRFGTKKVANAEKPGSDLGSAWHLLSGEGWLGAVGESHTGRKSPTLEAAQS